MLHIYAEGREVTISADTSFQYTVENPFVTEAEGYSLSIEAPIRAGDNLDIFGWIHRLDIDITKLRYDALLWSPRYSASGVLAVVGVSESAVKLQFLQGRSAQNFDSRLDSTYVNELDLGTSPLSCHYARTTPQEALASIDSGAVAVALPWIISSSGEMIHNRLRMRSDTHELVWHPDTHTLTFMPYLLAIAKRICAAAGYSHSFSAWEQSPMRHLILCNALPESLSLSNFAYALPHWTVSEFFSNIEFLLHGRFDIDSRSRRISFTTHSSAVAEAGTVTIGQVIDQFSATVEADPDNAQRPEFLRNRGYDSNSSRLWPLRCADWYILRRLSEADIPEEATAPSASHAPASDRSRRVGPASGWYYDTMADIDRTYRNVRRYDTLDLLIADCHRLRYSPNLPGADTDALLYAADVSCFFCIRATAEIPFNEIPQEYRSQYNLSEALTYYANVLSPVNDFGDYILDPSDDADRIDLPVVPVDVDQTDDHGLCCFLPFSESSESSDEIHQPKTYELLMAGKKDRPQYYDKLHVAYWDGLRTSYQEAGVYPLTSNVSIYRGWQYEKAPQGMDLRLNAGFVHVSPLLIRADFTKLYKISFLSDGIPDPKAIYIIRGKRYLCRKLTADFSASGLSRLIQGEFYRLT